MLQNVPFANIRDFKRSIPGLEKVGMNDFSRILNQVTDSEIANAGMGNKFEVGVKHYSASADDFLDKHAAPVQNVLGDAGGGSI